MATGSSFQPFQDAGALSFEGPADVALTLLECGYASTYLKGSRSYQGLFFPLEIVVFSQAGRGGAAYTCAWDLASRNQGTKRERAWGGLQ